MWFDVWVAEVEMSGREVKRRGTGGMKGEVRVGKVARIVYFSKNEWIW